MKTVYLVFALLCLPSSPGTAQDMATISSVWQIIEGNGEKIMVIGEEEGKMLMLGIRCVGITYRVELIFIGKGLPSDAALFRWRIDREAYRAPTIWGSNGVNAFVVSSLEDVAAFIRAGNLGNRLTLQFNLRMFDFDTRMKDVWKGPYNFLLHGFSPAWNNMNCL